ncbi:MAG: hypothetical protein ACRCT1_08010 [Microcoleaceae cyanobacterium]
MSSAIALWAKETGFMRFSSKTRVSHRNPVSAIAHWAKETGFLRKIFA